MSKLFIGTSGWIYKDWEGVFYPLSLNKSMQLKYLSNFFNTVEINSSFYRIPEEGMVHSWINKVKENPYFKFTLKAYGAWTHEENFKEEDGKKMKKILEIFYKNKRLGVLLFQFPYRIKYSINFLKNLNFFKEYFDGFPICVEIRNKSFLREDFFNFLREKGISFANIDQPLISQNIGPTAEFTSEPGYIRLHGRNASKWFTSEESFERYDYLYSKEELLPWVKTALELSKKGDTYVILNNHYRGKAIQNAFDFIVLLKNPVEKK